VKSGVPRAIKHRDASVIGGPEHGASHLPTFANNTENPAHRPDIAVCAGRNAYGRVIAHIKPMYEDGKTSQQVLSYPMRDNGEGQVCGCWSKKTAV
jgi:hypothetical protein